MDYQECYRLTFCGILVAFMELAFAYCLLCVSAFVFITSKFLAYLPCSCSGVLGYQNIQKILFDWPIRIILRIQKLATARTIMWHQGQKQEQEEFDIKNKKYFDLMDKVRLLEDAVEEERVAKAALMVELEEERAASASAADEAMAMILRLQADKASLEMEGKQYERMIEEKFAYDEEEMNILKEILFKREREKHFLEKELQTYKHIDDDQEIEDDNREGDVEDREPIVYDVHVIEDNSNNAKVRDDDDVVEHKDMKEMEDIVKQGKDHDSSSSSPTSSSIHVS